MRLKDINESLTFATAFDDTPVVMLTLSSTAPYNVIVGASDVSATGFTLNLFRTTTTTTNVMWIAMGKTQ